MRKLVLALAAGLCFAAPAAGQAVISQGMSADEVRASFGAPATVRESGEWAYWYYHNGCPNRCGSDDVVFFRGDRVVAAVLRTGARRFRGPAPDDALESAGGREQNGTMSADGGATVVTPRSSARDGDSRVRVGGVRVNGAAPARAEGDVIIVPSTGGAGQADGVQVREASEGERSTIRIDGAAGATGGVTTGAVQSTGTVDNTNPPNVDATDTTPDDTTEQGEVDETEGDSIERARERDTRDRRNEETSIERARRHDRTNRPPTR